MTTDTDSNIHDAFERLMLGRAEITDGTLTVSNICTEAGVSRVSYYRSPQAAAIKELLDAPRTQRPEVDDLRTQVKQLTRTERQLRAEHAGEVRDLRETVRTYANQIRVLALHADQLKRESEQLRNDLARPGGNVTPLSAALDHGADRSARPQPAFTLAAPAVRHTRLRSRSARETATGLDNLTDDIIVHELQRERRGTSAVSWPCSRTARIRVDPQGRSSQRQFRQTSSSATRACSTVARSFSTMSTDALRGVCGGPPRAWQKLARGSLRASDTLTLSLDHRQRNHRHLVIA
jgi:hypothetical protein